MIIQNLTAFVYDLEVFPNLFTCAVKNSESNKIRVYEISQRRNDMPKIVKLFQNKKIIFVSYNGIHYDNPIISYILINYSELIQLPVWEINKRLKEFSDLIINSINSKSWSQYKYANLFIVLDLLTMMFATKLRVGLKELQVTMEYKNVQEYDGDFNARVPLEDFDKVIKYNINDIESTTELMNHLEPDIRLREAVNQEFGINVLSTDGVNLGVEIIKTKYLEETGKSWWEIKDLRTPCDELDLKDIIFDFIKFETPECQALFNTVYNTHINLKQEALKKTSDRWKVKCYLEDSEITYSLGGVHTKNKPAIWKSDDDWVIIDSDCASMYPSAIINFGLYPSHLGPEFLTTYKKIRADRIKAKREGNKVLNLTYKLALNGISGMLQSEYSWCYDPKTVLKLRLNCQLMLLMLTEKLIKVGCKIGQLNTDGVLYIAPRNKLDEVMAVCKEWEQITKFELEHEYFEAFYQYAVNDYIGVYKGYSETHDPKLIKTKGLFLTEVTLGKGMAPQIIAQALQEYFVNDIPISDTIRNCQDIRKFLTYQKVKKEFSVEYNGKLISHINRYYMSTNGYRIARCTVDPITGTRSDYSDLCATSGVTIFNELKDIKPKDAHVNYLWYQREAYKIVNALEDSLNPTLF